MSSGRVTRQFGAAGIHDHECTLHGGMTATVVVQQPRTSQPPGAAMTRTYLLSAILAAVPAATGGAAPHGAPATHQVRMIQEGQSYRFQPSSLTIRPGDRVRFINVSGGPHNVSFDPARVPAAARAALSAGMPGQIQELWGPLVTGANAAYTVSFAGVPAGRYEFFCMPHLAMGMRGAVTVQ